MRKTLTIALVVSLMGFGTAHADILPEGQTAVQVCAYFNNTADFLDDITIYYYETMPGGARVDLSQLIADECVQPAYKFNRFGVYAVTNEHAATLDLDTYDPTVDEEAYPTKYKLEMGFMWFEDTTTIESISNEYYIAELDMEEKVLVVEPVSTTINHNDGSDPEVKEGEVTRVYELDEEEVIVKEEVVTEEEVVKLFTDVDSTSKYYDALKYLKDEGIIGGYPDGSYKPDTTINRAEFTKIVMGSISTPDELETCMTHYMVEGDHMVRLFEDIMFAAVGGNAPDWFFNFVCQAKKMSIVGGYPDGTFKPTQDINFVEASKIITNAVYGADDATAEPWYKNYVTMLENKGAIPASVKHFDHKLTRGEMAEIMYRLLAKVADLESLSFSDLQ